MEGDFFSTRGFVCGEQLIGMPDRPTAIFAANDLTALGVVEAVRQHNLSIPDDLSIIGFDDIPWAQYSDPTLTTIHLPAQELASEACLLLLDLMKGSEPEERNLVLDTELVVRKSCRKL